MPTVTARYVTPKSSRLPPVRSKSDQKSDLATIVMKTRDGSKGVSIYKNDRWNVAVNSHYLPSGQKNISFGQKRPQQTIWLRKLTIYLDI